MGYVLPDFPYMERIRPLGRFDFRDAEIGAPAKLGR